MSNPLSLKQYGEIIKYSDEFKRIIDLGDDKDHEEIKFLEITQKLAKKLIITVDSTERPDIFQATIHKTNLNGKFLIYDKVCIVKGRLRKDSPK